MGPSTEHEHLSRITKALAFAAHKHRDQRRKGVEQHPYINHPVTLADILVNEGGVTDIDAICAALLHDTIEDTEATVPELEAEFGETIAGIVVELSDDKDLPKAERKRLQIEHAPALSHGARLVKLADKIANLRDILAAPPPDWDAERKHAYFDWARQVVDGLRGTSEPLERAFDETHARAARELAC